MANTKWLDILAARVTGNEQLASRSFESETVGSVETEVPSLGVGTIEIFSAIKVLSPIEKRIEHIFPAKGQFPVFSQTLSDVKIKTRSRHFINIGQITDHVTVFIFCG